MTVRYWPLADCCRIPSEAEPYSPDIADWLPLAVFVRVSVPTKVAEVAFAPSWNSCKVMGEAVSSTLGLSFASPVLLETVLMTRSPELKGICCASAAPPSNSTPTQANGSQVFPVTVIRLIPHRHRLLLRSGEVSCDWPHRYDRIMAIV